MRKSLLPGGGVNLFQAIKAKTREAEASGQKIYRLSIGQPAGPALLSARKAAAEAVMSNLESIMNIRTTALQVYRISPRVLSRLISISAWPEKMSPICQYPVINRCWGWRN